MSQSTTPYRSSVLAEFRRAITNVAVPHHEPPGIVRRRRVVVGVTLVIGAVMLGFSLRRTPGESSFYWLTLALAAVWIAGALMLDRCIWVASVGAVAISVRSSPGPLSGCC